MSTSQPKRTSIGATAHQRASLPQPASQDWPTRRRAATSPSCAAELVTVTVVAGSPTVVLMGMGADRRRGMTLAFQGRLCLGSGQAYVQLARTVATKLRTCSICQQLP